jgi:hypothetical protein
MTRKNINVREYRKGQSKMDNPEKPATWGTQDEEKKTKKKHNMCWISLFAKNTNKVNKI